MTQIKRIDGWQTSDGQIFTDGADATRHQAHLNLREQLEDLGYSAITSKDTAEWLLKNYTLIPIPRVTEISQ
jgi:hypothetical protein